jgi:hypothetical protein
MPAAIYDILIEQGSTFQKTINLKDSDGDPRDLTSVDSVRGQVRRSFKDNTAYNFTLTVESPASSGVISWTMPATISATIDPVTPSPYFYDVELVFSNGVVERILQGRAEISAEVTR